MPTKDRMMSSTAAAEAVSSSYSSNSRGNVSSGSYRSSQNTRGVCSFPHSTAAAAAAATVLSPCESSSSSDAVNISFNVDPSVNANDNSGHRHTTSSSSSTNTTNSLLPQKPPIRPPLSAQFHVCGSSSASPPGSGKLRSDLQNYLDKYQQRYEASPSKSTRCVSPPFSNYSPCSAATFSSSPNNSVVLVSSLSAAASAASQTPPIAATRGGISEANNDGMFFDDRSCGELSFAMVGDEEEEDEEEEEGGECQSLFTIISKFDPKKKETRIEEEEVNNNIKNDYLSSFVNMNEKSAAEAEAAAVAPSSFSTNATANAACNFLPIEKKDVVGDPCVIFQNISPYVCCSSCSCQSFPSVTTSNAAATTTTTTTKTRMPMQNTISICENCSSKAKSSISSTQTNSTLTSPHDSRTLMKHRSDDKDSSDSLNRICVAPISPSKSIVSSSVLTSSVNANAAAAAAAAVAGNPDESEKCDAPIANTVLPVVSSERMVDVAARDAASASLPTIFTTTTTTTTNNKNSQCNDFAGFSWGAWNSPDLFCDLQENRNINRDINDNNAATIDISIASPVLAPQNDATTSTLPPIFHSFIHDNNTYTLPSPAPPPPSYEYSYDFPFSSCCPYCESTASTCSHPSTHSSLSSLSSSYFSSLYHPTSSSTPAIVPEDDSTTTTTPILTYHTRLPMGFSCSFFPKSSSDSSRPRAWEVDESSRQEESREMDYNDSDFYYNAAEDVKEIMDHTNNYNNNNNSRSTSLLPVTNHADNDDGAVEEEDMNVELRNSQQCLTSQTTSPISFVFSENSCLPSFHYSSPPTTSRLSSKQPPPPPHLSFATDAEELQVISGTSTTSTPCSLVNMSPSNVGSATSPNVGSGSWESSSVALMASSSSADFNEGNGGFRDSNRKEEIEETTTSTILSSYHSHHRLELSSSFPHLLSSSSVDTKEETEEIMENHHRPSLLHKKKNENSSSSSSSFESFLLDKDHETNCKVAPCCLSSIRLQFPYTDVSVDTAQNKFSRETHNASNSSSSNSPQQVSSDFLTLRDQDEKCRFRMMKSENICSSSSSSNSSSTTQNGNEFYHRDHSNDNFNVYSSDLISSSEVPFKMSSFSTQLSAAFQKHHQCQSLSSTPPPPPPPPSSSSVSVPVFHSSLSSHTTTTLQLSSTTSTSNVLNSIVVGFDDDGLKSKIASTCLPHHQQQADDLKGVVAKMTKTNEFSKSSSSSVGTTSEKASLDHEEPVVASTTSSSSSSEDFFYPAMSGGGGMLETREVVCFGAPSFRCECAYPFSQCCYRRPLHHPSAPYHPHHHQPPLPQQYCLPYHHKPLRKIRFSSRPDGGTTTTTATTSPIDSMASVTGATTIVSNSSGVPSFFGSSTSMTITGRRRRQKGDYSHGGGNDYKTGGATATAAAAAAASSYVHGGTNSSISNHSPFLPVVKKSPIETSFSSSSLISSSPFSTHRQSVCTLTPASPRGGGGGDGLVSSYLGLNAPFSSFSSNAAMPSSTSSISGSGSTCVSTSISADINQQQHPTPIASFCRCGIPPLAEGGLNFSSFTNSSMTMMSNGDLSSSSMSSALPSGLPQSVENWRRRPSSRIFQYSSFSQRQRQEEEEDVFSVLSATARDNSSESSTCSSQESLPSSRAAMVHDVWARSVVDAPQWFYR